MYEIKNLVCLTILLTMTTANAQDLSSHQWNDRIILVLSDTILDEMYQKQILELQNNALGLKERKLIVYHVQPEKFKKELSNSDWNNGTNLYKTYKKTNSRFEFVLIGLDNTVKLQQSEFLTCKKLFSIIDAMPMRQSEMQKKD